MKKTLIKISKPVKKTSGKALDKPGKGSPKGTLRICPRGHTYYKSSDCPVCPKCAAEDKKKLLSDFPGKMGAPALRALAEAKIKNLAGLAIYTEKELSKLHGMGPKALGMLKDEMRKRKLKFAK